MGIEQFETEAFFAARAREEHPRVMWPPHCHHGWGDCWAVLWVWPGIDVESRGHVCERDEDHEGAHVCVCGDLQGA